ncbi:MAG TPA: rod shape-determining protein RodA, partial [Holosporales bacterium]|nr:rod shape-determining protein RodA [Holosporales bacterium]
MRFATIIEKVRVIESHLLLSIIVVVFVGLAALYSAAGGTISPWASKQFMRFMVGLSLMIVIALVDIRFWRTYSYGLYFASLLLLVFVE